MDANSVYTRYTTSTAPPTKAPLTVSATRRASS